ncbi:MAG: sensor histidine kinase [Polyangiales bacterium]
MQYLVAIAAPSLAFLAQAAVWPKIPPSPFLLFYPATLAVAWWCGRWPSMVSIFIACLAIAYRFLDPIDSFMVASARDMLDLAIFAAVSAVMCTAAARLRVALSEAREARTATEKTAQAKDEILSIVSHDLRNPLSAIVLTAETMRRKAHDPAQSQEAERIKRLAMTASALVSDIVDLGWADAGILELDLRPESAAKLLAQALESAGPQADSRGISLEMRAGQDAVLCDAHRVQQILSNLLGNALRLVPPGGAIVVTATPLDSRMRFEVRDNGPGMSPESTRRVFERHYTGDRRGGLGLGLHIAKTLVRAHQGEIGAESDEGKGSAFWFTLPLAATRTSMAKSSVDFRPLTRPSQSPSS